MLNFVHNIDFFFILIVLTKVLSQGKKINEGKRMNET